MEAAVDYLDPSSSGAWLITTMGTRHLWDLDAGLYVRMPTSASRAGEFDYDGAWMRIRFVERWPRVGQSFFIWLDAPFPDSAEYWRQSSAVVSIEPIEADTDPRSILDLYLDESVSSNAGSTTPRASPEPRPVLHDDRDRADLLASRSTEGRALSSTELADLLQPFWNAAKVLSELDLPDQTALDELSAAGNVLGLQTADGAVIYPVWQFQRRGAKTEVRASVQAIATVLREHDRWRVAVLLHTPAPELEGSTPLDAGSRGVDIRVLQLLAARVKSEWHG